MSIELWRNVSLVWLSLLCFVALLIPLVILYFAVRGLRIAHQKVGGGLRRLRAYSQTMNQGSGVISQRVAEPVIRAQRQVTRWQTAIAQLWPGNQEKGGNS
jgi:predicted transcriptional regulator